MHLLATVNFLSALLIYIAEETARFVVVYLVLTYLIKAC